MGKKPHQSATDYKVKNKQFGADIQFEVFHSIRL
jgi:hypothetical protein